MKKKKHLLLLLLLLLIPLYSYIVYRANSSELVEFARPTTFQYQLGDKVPLVKGYYNVGFADLSGYYVTITGAHIEKTHDFLSKYNLDESFFDKNDIQFIQNNEYLCIVDAVFSFCGEKNPLDNAIDLTSFRLVGPNYYCNYSYELSGIDSFNPILKGNNIFSIGSGKDIELQLPFWINTKSAGSGISVEELSSHPPRLMVSECPIRVYISMPPIT